MTFEDLDAWKVARQLVRSIYSLTRQSELSKDFGLTDQLRRAGVSVMSNVAEGFERLHSQEKLQLYNVAHASSAEVRSLLYVVEDNYPECLNDLEYLRRDALRTGQLVGGLIHATRKRSTTRRVASVLLGILGL